MPPRARKAPAKRAAKDFDAVMAGLERILAPYGKTLTLKRSPRYGLVASGVPTKRYPDGMMFAAATPMKSYVSYHLMAMYMNAELKAAMSPALKARMQGKACFNFTAPDPVLFKELAELTRRGYEGFRKLGYVP